MGRQKPGKPRRTTEIRDAARPDAAAISQIMPEAFGLLGGRPWTDPAYVLAGLESIAAELSARTRMKVVCVDGKVVGCAYTALALHPDNVTAHPEVGVVHGIAVRPDYRGRGLGSLLLANSEAQLVDDGARVIVSEIRPAAVPLFKGAGYTRAVVGSDLVVPSSTGPYTLRCTGNMTLLVWKPAPLAALPQITARDEGGVTRLFGVLADTAVR
jgi:ribosomal protein S18 acetylase RimI-like enzyme